MRDPTGISGTVRIRDPVSKEFIDAQEYKSTDTPASNTHSCWIESIEGSEYDVSFQVPSSLPNDFAVDLYVDGHSMDSKVKYSRATDRQSTFEGMRADAVTVLPFRFKKLATTDDDNEVRQDETSTKFVGTIQLKFFRFKNSSPSLNADKLVARPDSVVFHERSKKADVGHSTDFGAPQTSAKQTYINVDYIDPTNKPMVTLEFKYRPRNILMAKDIIPYEAPAPDPESDRSASPPRRASGSGSKRSAKVIDLCGDTDGSDSEDELARLRREKAELRKRVKLEDGVKREEGSSPKGRFIDLSDL